MRSWINWSEFWWRQPMAACTWAFGMSFVKCNLNTYGIFNLLKNAPLFFLEMIGLRRKWHFGQAKPLFFSFINFQSPSNTCSNTIYFNCNPLLLLVAKTFGEALHCASQCISRKSTLHNRIPTYGNGKIVIVNLKSYFFMHFYNRKICGTLESPSMEKSSMNI